MTTSLKINERHSVARPLKVLVPLIQNELTEANDAGLEHYRRVGEMLLEVKESKQVPPGSWGRWLGKNFKLTKSTAYRYMALAKQNDSENSHGVGNQSPRSLNEATGQTERERERRQEQKKLWEPFKQAAGSLDVERLRQEKQAREQEVKLHREIALELVNLGYKAMAMRLHPDRSGSKEAMNRLNVVRDELQSIAETRRFV